MEFEKLFHGHRQDAEGVHVWATEDGLNIAPDLPQEGDNFHYAMELDTEGVVALSRVLLDFLEAKLTSATDSRVKTPAHGKVFGNWL